MKKHLATAICAATLAIGGSALAQEKTFDLKISHWVPPSHPLQKALEDWGASVEKDSGGTPAWLAGLDHPPAGGRTMD